MYFVCELSILFVCMFYNRKNGVYNCWGESMYTTPPASNNASHTPATHSQHHKSTLPQQNKFCHNSCYGAQGGLVVIIINLIFNVMIKFNDAVAALRKSGAKSEIVTICNVTITDCKNWTRIALTLNREVDGPVCDSEGNWSMGKTRVVFVSLYSILGLLKNTNETLAITNHIANNPTALQIILCGANGELLQQEVKAHATYINAFTGEETEHESDHDSIFNHLVSVEFTDKALRAIEKIEDKLLGL